MRATAGDDNACRHLTWKLSYTVQSTVDIHQTPLSNLRRATKHCSHAIIADSLSFVYTKENVKHYSARPNGA